MHNLITYEFVPMKFRCSKDEFTSTGILRFLILYQENENLNEGHNANILNEPINMNAIFVNIPWKNYMFTSSN